MIHALGNECKLNWRISGVEPVTSQISLVHDPKHEPVSSDENDGRTKAGGGSSSTSKAVIKTVAKRKAKPGDSKVTFADRFAARADRACPDFNSKKGCVKNQRQCPHKRPHMCGARGKFGHAKGSPKCALTS